MTAGSIVVVFVLRCNFLGGIALRRKCNVSGGIVLRCGSCNVSGGKVLRCELLATFCSVPKMQDKTVLEVFVFATNLLGFCVILFSFDRYIAYCLDVL